MDRPKNEPRRRRVRTATTEPQQERAIRTRAAIIERGADVFAERGYEAASLNDIARSLGLTKGAFYFHFASKEALALAVFRVKQTQLAERLRAVADEQPNALDGLLALLRARAELLQNEPSLRCFLGLTSELVAHFGPGSEFAASYNVPIDTFAALVRKGQQQGVIRRSLDPRSTAETVFAALLGTDEMSKVVAGGKDLLYRTERWLEVIVAGLAVDPPATRGRPIPSSRQHAGRKQSATRRSAKE